MRSTYRTLATQYSLLTYNIIFLQAGTAIAKWMKERKYIRAE